MNTIATATRPALYTRSHARKLHRSLKWHEARGLSWTLPTASRATKRAEVARRLASTPRVDSKLIDTHLAGVKLLPGQWADGEACYAVIRGGVDIGTITRRESYIEVMGAYTSNHAVDLPGAVDICVEMRDRWERAGR